MNKFITMRVSHSAFHFRFHENGACVVNIQQVDFLHVLLAVYVSHAS